MHNLVTTPMHHLGTWAEVKSKQSDLGAAALHIPDMQPSKTPSNSITDCRQQPELAVNITPSPNKLYTVRGVQKPTLIAGELAVHAGNLTS